MRYRKKTASAYGDVGADHPPKIVTMCVCRWRYPADVENQFDHGQSAWYVLTICHFCLHLYISTACFAGLVFETTVYIQQSHSMQTSQLILLHTCSFSTGQLVRFCADICNRATVFEWQRISGWSFYQLSIWQQC